MECATTEQAKRNNEQRLGGTARPSGPAEVVQEYNAIRCPSGHKVDPKEEDTFDQKIIIIKGDPNKVDTFTWGWAYRIAVTSKRLWHQTAVVFVSDPDAAGDAQRIQHVSRAKDEKSIFHCRHFSRIVLLVPAGIPSPNKHKSDSR